MPIADPRVAILRSAVQALADLLLAHQAATATLLAGDGGKGRQRHADLVQEYESRITVCVSDAHRKGARDGLKRICAEPHPTGHSGSDVLSKQRVAL